MYLNVKLYLKKPLTQQVFWNVTKKIEKGNELFGDYGPQFWENFDQDGQNNFASSVASYTFWFTIVANIEW